MAGMIGRRTRARKFGVDGMSKHLFAGPAAITMARGCNAPHGHPAPQRQESVSEKRGRLMASQVSFLGCKSGVRKSHCADFTRETGVRRASSVPSPSPDHLDLWPSY